MANDTKKEAAANTVEQRLKSLYQLQTVLSEIDRIKTIRGELPLEVKDLEDSIAGLNTRIDNYTAEIAELDRSAAESIDLPLLLGSLLHLLFSFLSFSPSGNLLRLGALF